MSFTRAPRPETGFTMVANAVLRDRRLSFKARGILACILSLPPGASVSEDQLAEASEGDGTTAVRSGIKELRDAGYIVRRVVNDPETGRVRTLTMVFDNPQNAQESAEESPSRGFPASRVSRVAENPRATTKTLTLFSTTAGSSPESVETSESKKKINTENRQRTARRAPADVEAPERKIAKAVYDHASGMVPFMGMTNVARAALRVQGATPETVERSMIAIYDSGRPVTLQTVGQHLTGRTQANGASGHVAPDGEIDVNAVLGRDVWTMPDVPDHLVDKIGSPEHREWAEAERAKRHAVRLEKAKEVLRRRGHSVA